MSYCGAGWIAGQRQGLPIEPPDIDRARGRMDKWAEIRDPGDEFMRWSILAVVALVVAGPVALAEPPPDYPFVGYDDGLRQARAGAKPVLVYFGRYGCGWCEKVNRETFSDPALRADYSQHYALIYIDTESGARLTLPSGERITERELAARMQVLATPMFAFLDSAGREIFRVSGIQSIKDFHDYDRYIRGGHYRRQGLREFLSQP